MYIFAHWLQMRAEVAKGYLTPGLYKSLSGLKLFEEEVANLSGKAFPGEAAFMYAPSGEYIAVATREDLGAPAYGGLRLVKPTGEGEPFEP